MIRFARNDKNAAYHLAEAVKAGKYAPRSHAFDETMDVVDFDLHNPADMSLWLHCRPPSGWNNAESAARAGFDLL